MNGNAEVSYTQYAAEADGKEVFSGDSLVQNYSLAWTTTNLVRRSQPRYYTFMAGYNWTSFNTQVTDAGVDSELKDSYGKFRYNGEVGYSSLSLPIKFRAYINDLDTPRLQYDIYQGLMADGLIQGLEGRSKSVSSGFSFLFEPEEASSNQLRGLPRLHVDYQERRNKIMDRFYKTDELTKELAVAGLNKENNWLHYRNLKYENFLRPSEGYFRQQIQLGLIDYAGRRKWTPLTNWILVSADGQLTSRKGTIDRSVDEDEYDINFQAIATRKTWEARTFMNYNRVMDKERITQQVKVPLYVKGIWGADTTWFLRAAADRIKEKQIAGQLENSDRFRNILAVGATTFLRSAFTLSPNLSLQTEKSRDGVDSYAISGGVETQSTRRYSDKLFLTAGYSWEIRDDGRETEQSKTWGNKISFKGNYRPAKSFIYELKEDIELGSGNAFGNVNSSTPGIHDYLRSLTTASVAFIGAAGFTASLDAIYDFVRTSDVPDIHRTGFRSRLLYSKNNTFFNLYANYTREDNGIDKVTSRLDSTGEIQYRPDRYHDALVRYTLDKENDLNIDRTTIELLQRYTRNFFTKAGVIRKLGNIAQEFSYKSDSINGGKIDSKYLLLSGRYSPTSRLSLYGSVKYQSDPNAISMYYNAGVTADFKLLATSLDYSLAKRDSDNRTEKKISATVRRSF